MKEIDEARNQPDVEEFLFAVYAGEEQQDEHDAWDFAVNPFRDEFFHARGKGGDVGKSVERFELPVDFRLQFRSEYFSSCFSAVMFEQAIGDGAFDECRARYGREECIAGVVGFDLAVEADCLEGVFDCFVGQRHHVECGEEESVFFDESGGADDVGVAVRLVEFFHAERFVACFDADGDAETAGALHGGYHFFVDVMDGGVACEWDAGEAARVLVAEIEHPVFVISENVVGEVDTLERGHAAHFIDFFDHARDWFSTDIFTLAAVACHECGVVAEAARVVTAAAARESFERHLSDEPVLEIQCAVGQGQLGEVLEQRTHFVADDFAVVFD